MASSKNRMWFESDGDRPKEKTKISNKEKEKEATKTGKPKTSTDKPKKKIEPPKAARERMKELTMDEMVKEVEPGLAIDKIESSLMSGRSGGKRWDSSLERLDLSTPGRHSVGERPFFIDDDRKSKITVVSLKSSRTNRTSNTIPSIVEPNTEEAKVRTFGKVKDGFRKASIKRIVGAGFVVATFFLLLFGGFLPFWIVYTSTIDNYVTAYYGGLWNYCLILGDETHCYSYAEADLESWMKFTRFCVLTSFMGVCGLLGVTVAYMFFFREKKYIFLQWIIIGMCYGVSLCILLGLIVFGASYPISSHISSAYGLTFCAFFCCLASAFAFLWDKLVAQKKQEAAAAAVKTKRAAHTPRSHQPVSVRSYRSFAQSSKLGSNSHKSHITSSKRY